MISGVFTSLKNTYNESRIFLLISGVTIIGVAVFSFKSHHQLVKKVEESNFSRQLITDIEEVLWNLRKAESDKRGYLLTHTENFLKSYDEARKALDNSINKINTYPDERIKKALTLLEERKTLLGASSDIKNNSKKILLNTKEKANVVLAVTSEIEKISSEIINENETIVRTNEDRIHNLERNRFILDVISSLLVLLMISIELVLATRSNRAMLESESSALEAKRKAEIASKHKSEFLSQMSHEIRTPLHGVLGMSQLLGSTPLNAQQADYVEAISISGQNLLLIINDILDFSKIEAGKLEIEENEFDLFSYTTEICKPFIYASEKKGIQFEMDFPELPFLINSDSTKIGQIILNLTSNAIKFTSTGKVEVSYHFRAEKDGRVFLKFEIKDTGIGIPENTRERMFKAFSQGSNSTSRQFGGTGLGLSICKGLVDLLGGKIGFESRPNVGTVFWFEIDVKKGNVKLANFGKKIATKFEVNGNWGQGKRILVAEDNQINQRVIGEFLKRAGLKYHIVNHGNEVLNALRESHFDLILMDCQMPELDGYETSKIIRASHVLDYCNIPIVALTANAAKTDAEKCKACGMNDYLTKPVEPKTLYDCLEKYLSPIRAESIDQNTIQELTQLESEGDAGFLVELIGIFMKTSPEKIEKIDALIDENRIKEAGKIAHSLKSSAHTLGATHLAKLCQEFENLSATNLNKETATQLAHVLRDELENVKTALTKVEKDSLNKAA